MAAQELSVRGMTCEHCVRAVTEEIASLAGVTEVSVDLQPGAQSRVTVIADPMPSTSDLAAAVAAAGYELATS